MNVKEENEKFILRGYNDGFAFLIVLTFSFFVIFPFRLPKTENQPPKVFKRTRELTSVEKGHDKAC